MEMYNIVLNDTLFKIKRDADGNFIIPEDLKIGSAIKPAHEPICLARKPLSEKSIAENCLKWGTGGINIQDCRIKYSETNKPIPQLEQQKLEVNSTKTMYDGQSFNKSETKATIGGSLEGRWPANVILSHSDDCKCVGTKKVKGTKPHPIISSEDKLDETYGRNKSGEIVHYGDENGLETVESWECVDGCPIKIMNEQSGNRKTNRCENPSDCGGNTWGGTFQTNRPPRGYTDEGGSSRFFLNLQSDIDLDDITPFIYCSKSSTKERNEGCEELDDKIGGNHNESGRSYKTKCRICEKEIRFDGRENRCLCEQPEEYYPEIKSKNNHPTVKSISLMRYLCRLITPKGGTVLDPFMGSGSTGVATILEDFNFIGIEKEPDYFEISKARITHHQNKHNPPNEPEETFEPNALDLL